MQGVDLSLLVPYGYGTARRSLEWLQGWLLEHHHPEFVRRIIPWLHSKAGVIGVGGGWRATQPNATGFAPPGKSFHQDQRFADGFVGAAAVDLVKLDPKGGVHLAPQWSDVPEQGSAEAARWGVHCNVGHPGLLYPQAEPWHMQPIELDGYDLWVAQGRPAPKPNYPLPTDATTPSPLPLPILEDDMAKLALVRRRNTADAFIAFPATEELLRRLGILGQKAVVIDCDLAELEAAVGYKLKPKAE